jgi:hypothetical protein
MGARERWFTVMIRMTSENDGARYLRRGPEESQEDMDVQKAAERYGKQRILAELKQAVRLVEGL